MTHPALDSLADLVVRPEAVPAADLLAHLSGCRRCRQQLARLSRVQAAVQLGMEREPISEGEMEAIADYVDGRLPASARASLARQLAQHKSWMRAALHYAAGASRRPPAPTLPGQGGLSGWLRWLRAAWRMGVARLQPAPAWAALAAALLMVPLLVLLLRTAPAPETVPGLVLAPYQDGGQLQISAGEMPPGIGFFAGARDSEQRPYTGVSADVDSAGKIVLSWPPIVGATEYHLSLTALDGSPPRPVAELSAQATRVELPLPAQTLRPGVRYQWELRGRLADNRRFSARGGFVPVAPAEQTR